MSNNNRVRIERTKIDLSKLESDEQFEFFCDVLSRRHLHQDCTIIGDRKDFPAVIETMEVGSSFCSAIKAPIHTLERTVEHITADERRDMYLVYVFSGTINGACGDEVMRASAGDAMFVDLAKPFSFKTESDSGFHSTFSIRLHRGDYIDREENKVLYCEKKFKQHRLASLLKTSMIHLATNMKGGVPDMETATLLGVVETLIELIAHDRSTMTIDPAGKDATHLIVAEIARQLEDDNLSSLSIAHHLGLSAERVEEIALGRSTSFADLVREERLSLAMSRLCDENHRGKTIEQIAYGCGFTELSSFYRAFKSEFQSTPSEIRRSSEKPSQLN